MSSEKIEQSFRETTGKRLKNTSPLKMFNILRDLKDDEKFLNIFRSFVVNDSVFNNERLYEEHQVEENDWLDNISYQYYETDALWWIIAMTNNIVNPFEEPKAGDSLRILKQRYVYKILKEIEHIGDL